MDAVTGYVFNPKGGNLTSSKIGLSLGIISLFILSAIAPIGLGLDIKELKVTFDKQLNYDAYSIDESYGYEPINDIEPEYRNIESKEIESYKELTEPTGGPMDSPWPMYCHDIRHTGRSPYSTSDNPGIEKWRYNLNYFGSGGIVIDEDGIIYAGADSIYALYPNGTLKWRFEERFPVYSTPAIDENGVIYVASYDAGPQYMWAINKEDGSLKWKYHVGDWVASSPVIGEDGSIYFGSENDNIYALWPNGTLKWKYKTDIAVYSSPAIGNDGTVYCGSHDNNLYAFYPNNGTVKWKYKTGHWVRVSPCIGDDGTIYCVSLDNYLHAVYPNNGTCKWRTSVGAGTSPTIGQDGTIYAGYSTLIAINPIDGSKNWVFNPGSNRFIMGATPCSSSDGTIFFGTHIGDINGGELIAVNPNGTEKWRIRLAEEWCDAPPTIGEDGTIYIGSQWGNPFYGFIHAIGTLDPNAPTSPIIDGPSTAKEEITKTFYFTSVSPFGRDVFYYVEWGDGKTTDWNGPHKSGEEITLGHAWGSPGSYTIKARAKDTDNLWGPWGEFEIVITRPRTRTSSYWMQFLDSYPILKEVLLRLIR